MVALKDKKNHRTQIIGKFNDSSGADEHKTKKLKLNSVA
jgi:hypothetical protein